MKKNIIGCIVVLALAIVFNFMVMPFISAYFQPDNIALVNDQLSNDGIMSSTRVQSGLLMDTIVMMAVNFVLVIVFGIFLYKICEVCLTSEN